jgi:hypothetical protein
MRKDLFEAEFLFDFRGIVVIEEEFLTGGDGTGGVEADAEVAADLHEFGEAVGVGRVVDEAGLVAHLRGVDGIVLGQVEEIAVFLGVVDGAPAVGVFLGDDLAHVLVDELALLDGFPHKGADTSDGRGVDKNALLKAIQQIDVLAAPQISILSVGGLCGPTALAQNRVAFSVAGIARTAVCLAASLAPTATPADGTLLGTATQRLAHVVVGDARAAC